MNRELSSEEKLLKLIRKKDAGNNAKNSRTTGGEKDKISLGIQKKRVNINFLKKLNKLLLALCAICSILVLVIYILPDSDNANMYGSGRDKNFSHIGVYGSGEEKPFSYYKSVLEKRDVFKLPWENDKNVANDITESSDLTKKFKILGIMLDESPLVAIEDLTIRQTFFLSEGDEISGITIDKILEDKIIVSYNGEPVELAP